MFGETDSEAFADEIATLMHNDAMRINASRPNEGTSSEVTNFLSHNYRATLIIFFFSLLGGLKSGYKCVEKKNIKKTV